mmetsp:Transcript_1549/g.3975  ORF Transcript_1549/g.3975 Transcript_1549/m.3975 type:complete len:245 (-) Transcript_1549:240-974(-)
MVESERHGLWMALGHEVRQSCLPKTKVSNSLVEIERVNDFLLRFSALAITAFSLLDVLLLLLSQPRLELLISLKNAKLVELSLVRFQGGQGQAIRRRVECFLEVLHRLHVLSLSRQQLSHPLIFRIQFHAFLYLALPLTKWDPHPLRVHHEDRSFAPNHRPNRQLHPAEARIVDPNRDASEHKLHCRVHVNARTRFGQRFPLLKSVNPFASASIESLQLLEFLGLLREVLRFVVKPLNINQFCW